MYIVELAFDGSPDRLELRPAHRQKLTDLRAKGTLVQAGPFPDESGAVLIFDLPDEAAVDETMSDDPYYRAKGVTVVRKQPWNPLPL